jgi:hypothetical protein
MHGCAVFRNEWSRRAMGTAVLVHPHQAPCGLRVEQVKAVRRCADHDPIAHSDAEWTWPSDGDLRACDIAEGHLLASEVLDGDHDARETRARRNCGRSGQARAGLGCKAQMLRPNAEHDGSCFD